MRPMADTCVASVKTMPAPARRSGTEVLDVPVAAQPVAGAVLAHRRHDDAVAGSDRPKADRLKEQRCRHEAVLT